MAMYTHTSTLYIQTHVAAKVKNVTENLTIVFYVFKFLPKWVLVHCIHTWFPRRTEESS